jgi:TetR/AcrR family transcriptional regulator, regulator of cefoperazone and chloramphenicol sensitivity
MFETGVFSDMQPEIDKTSERFIEAAGEVFAERGFEQATVRDICQQAGANLAAVNYYFGDKQRLYIEAVKRAHRWKMAQADLPKWADDASPAEMLGDVILTFVRRMKLGDRDTWQNRLMMREMTRSNGACAELVRDSIRPQFDILMRVLGRLLPPGISDERLRLTTFSVVGQCLFYHIADPVIRNLVDEAEYAKQTPEMLAEHITRFTLAAIQTFHGSAEREAPAKISRLSN